MTPNLVNLSSNLEKLWNEAVKYDEMTNLSFIREEIKKNNAKKNTGVFTDHINAFISDVI